MKKSVQSNGIFISTKSLVLAVFIISSPQVCSDCSCRISFDVMSFQHVNQFTIFEKRYTRRTWRKWRQKFSRFCNCIGIETSKNSGQMVRFFIACQGLNHARSCCSCCTTTNGINHQKSRSLFFNGVVNCFSCR